MIVRHVVEQIGVLKKWSIRHFRLWENTIFAAALHHTDSHGDSRGRVLHSKK